MAHNHQDRQAIVNRLSRAIGHLESVKDMVEQERDCYEILTQITAVQSAINNIGKIILREHINHCVVTAVQESDDPEKVLDDLALAIDRFIK